MKNINKVLRNERGVKKVNQTKLNKNVYLQSYLFPSAFMFYLFAETLIQTGGQKKRNN